jgi:hypothetical protein
MKIGAGIKNSRDQIKSLLILFCLPWLFVSSCDKMQTAPLTTNITSYNTQYAGIFESADPKDSTNAYGNVSAVYNSFSHEFNFNIHWYSLTSLPIAIHFNDKDSIMFGLPVFPRVLNDSISGSVHITSKHADDLSAGYVFVMIHTINYPYGEVMASIDKQ